MEKKEYTRPWTIGLPAYTDQPFAAASDQKNQIDDEGNTTGGDSQGGDADGAHAKMGNLWDIWDEKD